MCRQGLEYLENLKCLECTGYLKHQCMHMYTNESLDHRRACCLVVVVVVVVILVLVAIRN